MQTLRDLFRAALWLALYVVLALYPLLVLLAAPAPYGGDFSQELGSALGFLAISTMAMQFLLTARFQWLAPPFGTDLVYFFHRNVTAASLAMAVLHPFLLLGWDPRDWASLLLPWDAGWTVGTGVVALHATFLLGLTSWWRRRLRLPYEPWRWLHIVAAAVAIGGAVLHALASGRLLSNPVMRWFWLGWTLAWAGLLLRVRIAKPIVLLRRPWKVVEVRQERGDVTTLALEPDGHPGFRFRAGQFAWLTLGRSPFLAAEHPFSFSGSAQRAPRIEFAVKAVGDWTRAVKDTPIGARAFVDGPFGTLSMDAFPDADGYVFVAGGSGIAPALSMLRTLAGRNDRRPMLLLFGTYDWEGTPFRDELEELSERLNLTVVHVLERPPGIWPGERGYVTQALLDRWRPRSGRHAWFVCGPPRMMDAVERALSRLGVPASDVHSERFDLV